ncbi:Pentatricopeptide repeat-containing protein [Thalictrum thalictroides]|uniref:Pentatricopeptide repeat-containing protein n=1 Tax=Thalictrum thalictroides TaxID=46969 RepID=A0A7J6W0M8_THATH|nr:Pentatricopeptide repeat-containing protein [Thalictrum thalictroides]
MDYATSIFDGITLPNIFCWNTMINGYSKTAKPEKGILVYTRMRSHELSPNMYTFPILSKACSGLFSLSQVHGQIVKFGMIDDVYVISSLIHSYSKYGTLGSARQAFDENPNRNIVCWTSLITGYCFHGLVHEARKLFDRMPERNDVCWSAMMSGYAQNECFNEAIQLFHELKDRCLNLMPNQSLLVSVLNACAGLGASLEGKWIHSYIDEKGFEYGLELGTALIEFYAKCGFIETAQQVFHKMRQHDVMSWSAMIMGAAINGYIDFALKLLVDMEKSGTKPNAITFIGVLTACSHGGLVDEGWRLFDSMSRDYGIIPRIEHYGCLVDLLGRAGKIKEAEQLITSMPIKPDAIIWGALLNGCMMHGHLELGERVGKHLIEVEPQHSGRYVLLANMYAIMARWEGVSELRRLMMDREVTTVSGWSSIEVGGDVHKFIVADKSHPLSGEIYGLLNQLKKEMIASKSRAYSP